MKKKTMVLALIILILIPIVACAADVGGTNNAPPQASVQPSEGSNNASSEESGEIDLHLVGSAEINVEGILDWLGVTIDAPITFFYQFTNIVALQSFLNSEAAFDLSEMEFNPDEYVDRYFIITIGRELVDIKYTFVEEHWAPRTMTRSIITLSEEHDANILYIYVANQIPIFPADLAGIYNSFYIISGTERILKGRCLFELNGMFDDQQ